MCIQWKVLMRMGKVKLLSEARIICVMPYRYSMAFQPKPAASFPTVNSLTLKKSLYKHLDQMKLIFLLCHLHLKPGGLIKICLLCHLFQSQAKENDIMTLGISCYLLFGMCGDIVRVDTFLLHKTPCGVCVLFLIKYL